MKWELIKMNNRKKKKKQISNECYLFFTPKFNSYGLTNLFRFNNNNNNS